MPEDPSVVILRQATAKACKLNDLRSTGVLGRWQACQSAIANYHAPCIAQAKTFWGGMMEVDIREAVGSSIFIHGAYEPELSSFFYRFLQPGQTFVDIGAHVGYFSLLAAARVGEQGRVVSLEPCERTFWRLTKNTQSSKWVQRHRVAAWESETLLTLHDYGPIHSAFNSIGERRIHESAPPVKSTPFEVRAVPLDEFFQETQTKPDVIKIDAESAEVQVLHGLRKTLGSIRPVITLEVGDYSHLVAKGLPRSIDFLQIAMAHDYSLYEPSLEGISPHALRDSDYEYGNIVAVPNEKREEFESAFKNDLK
jgi:FkbM family methyltransferase